MRPTFLESTGGGGSFVDDGAVAVRTSFLMCWLVNPQPPAAAEAAAAAAATYLLLASPASSIKSMHCGLKIGFASCETRWYDTCAAGDGIITSYSLISAGSAAALTDADAVRRKVACEPALLRPTAAQTHTLLQANVMEQRVVTAKVMVMVMVMEMVTARIPVPTRRDVSASLLDAENA